MFSPLALHFSTWGWLAVIGGALAIGLSKGGLTGLGILPVLCFAAVLPAKASTGLVLPLLVAGDICAVCLYYRMVLWPVFFRLLLPALAGVIAGFFCMGHVSEPAFRPLIGWIVLVLVLVQFLRSAMGTKLDRFFASSAFGLFMGALAGFTTMIANAAGPVATLYFVSVRLPKWNLIGTAAFFFFVVNLSKIPFSARLGLINGYSLRLTLVLAPLVILGFFAGRFAAAKMPQTIFEIFLLICTAIGALKLIL